MKRFFAYATLLLLSLCLTVPALAAGPAITEGAAVTDLGGVLTAEERLAGGYRPEPCR